MLCSVEQEQHSLRVLPQWKISVEDNWDESVLVTGERASKISLVLGK